ncbi:MAG: hypothetical protein QF918_03220 [Pirellulaceae bacterium]|nr:hypothetical protein [Pirellulaceae bacterium]
MTRMSRVRAVVLFLVGGCFVALTGCSNPARERIIGNWEASFEMTEEDMEKMAPTDNPILAEFGNLLMKSMRAEMAWEFSADDTVAASATLLGNSITRTGSWRYISGDENSTTIKVEFENEEPRELSFTFSDPNTIEATPFSSGKWKWNRIVKFKRVVPTP